MRDEVASESVFELGEFLLDLVVCLGHSGALMLALFYMPVQQLCELVSSALPFDVRRCHSRQALFLVCNVLVGFGNVVPHVFHHLACCNPLGMP
ncbi:hypothetical protein AB0J47_18275 [Nocardia sp. NPDC049737]|uniref:hypothetical protein n=1 Tax=Nocardia sp. NPDC049737 TaxID=3154358 RepID=UPI00343E9AD0